MSVLRILRRERFARLVAAGATPEAAYRADLTHIIVAPVEASYGDGRFLQRPIAAGQGHYLTR